MSPSFEDAYSAMKEAEEKFNLARSAAEPDLTGAHLRMAFYNLYRAVRLANMLYVNRSRRGVVAEGGLLTRAKTEFEDFTGTLYLKYFRRGDYPKDDFEGEFNRWFDKARGYLNRLNTEAKLEQSVKPARDWTHRQPRVDKLNIRGLGSFR
jgi:hypothetical protein